MSEQLVTLLAIAIVYGVMWLFKSIARHRGQRAGAPHTRSVTVRAAGAATPPSQVMAAPTVPPPFLRGEEVQATPPVTDVTRPRRARRLPGGTDPRAAVIWGEVLRRKF